ncbi:16S rRNA (guanine(966)-N(2))-methyltransferase RsmD [Paenibacillus crassostreae]|uniref:16S rRNA (Guanine(966)-N(2))-methyltransferase RsmD n=1 Tax=Paenibacillus crassostreae TaxID=1763538 RepID=A0A167FQ39_9BACL|nr:16S rRNA (guanine(966)-N(2))-methyltransferase RsmD [Paenibacillus crassostreae]AOZ94177.1 16S rRNA (guanine(966)-N(2))-methyltransferase RsmD [Paenibacillus crassostreae]OAB76787.1 16S rRNA (guanine(966)-N(2))-methyltransferase RsmD [Paenibacillus crassostreae]
MRVVSGSAKGRPLKSVPGIGTRPTTDKVKEAIFSMIGPYFEGGTVLDLFAGTGGLGIEALSRGMENAIFIDMDPKSVETIRANLKATRLESQAEVFRNDAERAIKVLAKRELLIDTVFLDPPYRLKNADELLQQMHERSLLQHHATIVIEHDSKFEYPDKFSQFNCVRKALYGESAVTIYEYHADDLETEIQTIEEDQHGTAD